MTIEILDSSKREKSLENYLNEASEAYMSLENGIATLDSDDISMEVDLNVKMDFLEDLWDKIVNLFKNLCTFIANLIRSKSFQIQANSIYKKIQKLRSKDLLKYCDWKKEASLSKTILVATKKITNIINENNGDEMEDVGKLIKNNENSKKAITIINYFDKLNKENISTTVGKALEMVTKTDPGLAPVTDGSIESLENCMRSITNNSSERIKTLLIINDQANRKLKKAIKAKSMKKSGSYQLVAIYKNSIKLNNICTKTLIKNVNYIFKLSKVLLHVKAPKDGDLDEQA